MNKLIIDHDTGEVLEQVNLTANNGNSLVIFERAKQALAEAVSIDEIKMVIDQAEALRLCYKQVGDSLEMQNQCWSLKIRARRRMGEMIREMQEAGILAIRGRPEKNYHHGSLKLTDIGIDNYNESSRAQKFADIPEELLEEYEEETADKERTDTGLKTYVKNLEHQADIEHQKEEIATNDFTPLSGLFNVIAIDPPWPYGTKYNASGRRAANPYPEMSLDDIANIDLPAADDCILWLWTTHKFMRYSFDILDRWGFRDVAILTWVKDRMGLGSWLRSQTEFCIMAVRGKPLIDLTNQVTVIYGEMREHSRKPESFYELVDLLCVGYKLDYFSREQREGWVSFGNDTERF